MIKEYGNKLIELYSNTLGITKDVANIIISNNKTATILLEQELALMMTSDKENLSLLLQCTLIRDKYDFSKLKNDEEEILLKYYGIELQ